MAVSKRRRGLTDDKVIDNLIIELNEQFSDIQDQITSVSGGTQGGGGGSTTLSGLTDVLIASATTGQALVWNGSKWGNNNLALNDMSDVILGSPPLANGQVLTYNGSEWVNNTAPSSGPWSEGVVATTARIGTQTSTAGASYSTIVGYTNNIQSSNYATVIGNTNSITNGTNYVSINGDSNFVVSGNTYVDILGNSSYTRNSNVRVNSIDTYYRHYELLLRGTTTGGGTTNLQNYIRLNQRSNINVPQLAVLKATVFVVGIGGNNWGRYEMEAFVKSNHIVFDGPPTILSQSVLSVTGDTNVGNWPLPTFVVGVTDDKPGTDTITIQCTGAYAYGSEKWLALVNVLDVNF